MVFKEIGSSLITGGRYVIGTVGAICVVAIALIACNQSNEAQYVCENGTPRVGYPAGYTNIELCIDCNDGYHLQGSVCNINAYMCDNGAPEDGVPIINREERCFSCNSGYHLIDSLCEINSYNCQHGIPLSGEVTSIEGESTIVNGENRCESCIEGYILEDDVCRQAMFTCDGGTPVGGNPAIGHEDIERCDSCDEGYHENENEDEQLCIINTYTCANGTAAAPGSVGEHGEERCVRCLDQFALFVADNTCRPDADYDGVADFEDVDDDNDGLIEIHNLDMLHNINYNLDGTSYDDEQDDGPGNEGETAGAPTTATADCATESDGVYLCGYELVRSLDFDIIFDYIGEVVNTSWLPNAIIIDDATNRGWPGIGADNSNDNIDDSNAFNAIFDGNGYTISNVYQRGSTGNIIGLFNATGGKSHIRSLGVLSTALYGSNSSDIIGSIVGHNRGTITGSYATGAINGARSNDIIGGLVGHHNAGDIIASNASVIINGGHEADFVGGLVGYIGQGRIISGYATGTVTGGPGGDFVGGLVGRIGHNASGIIASYATGNISGGDDSNDRVGGLVGENGGYIVASYATGTVRGEGSASTAGGADYVGGLVGYTEGIIIASYADGIVSGDDGDDRIGGLAGEQSGTSTNIISSYGFGTVLNDTGDTVFHEPRPAGFSATAKTLQIADSNIISTYAGSAWNSSYVDTLNAWIFGGTLETPQLRYADYDGSSGARYNCDIFPAVLRNRTPLICDTTLLPGQAE